MLQRGRVWQDSSTVHKLEHAGHARNTPFEVLRYCVAVKVAGVWGCMGRASRHLGSIETMLPWNTISGKTMNSGT